jgi:hypothetical protein
MRSAREVPEEPSSSAAKGAHALAITDGEVNFLWWFIQGSIMNPETRDRLMRGGGFCERHAWVHLSAETTFREWYLLGPAILYRALIEQSLRAFRPQLGSAARLARRLEPAGSCFLCEMHLHAASSGVAPQRRLDQGRDTGALRASAAGLEPLWRQRVCGMCRGNRNRSANRCRGHLLDDIWAGKRVDIRAQQAMLANLAAHLDVYEHSFTWGRHGSASDADRAAFLAAVGWCSGWRPLLALLR